MLHLKSFLFLSLVLCSIALPCPALSRLWPISSRVSAKPTINPIVHVALSLPTYLLFDQVSIKKIKFVRKGKGKEKRGRDVPGGVEKNEMKRNESGYKSYVGR